MSSSIWHSGRPESVYEALVQAERYYGDRPFLCVLPEVASVYGLRAGELTYYVVKTLVDELAERLGSAGYGPGHRVGLLLGNRPLYFLSWFALNSLGVSVVPINPDLRASELQYLVAHSDIAAAVVLPERAVDIEAAAGAAGRAVAVITPDDDTMAAPLVRASRSSGRRRDEECAVLYTSGTTGYPKGCVLTNDYFLISAEWYAGVGGSCTMRRGSERMLTPLPTFHMNAMATSTMAMLALGGCLIPLDRFHPKTWWHCVRQSRATVVHYLGVMPAILMAAPESEQDCDHAVRFGFGAGVPRDLHLPFEKRFGFPLIEAWAMTETGSGAVIAATHEPRHPGTSCVGRPSDDLQVKLASEDGSEAPPGETGELLVRRRGVEPRRGFFHRYLKDPDATEAAWAGGWFHTGDLVRQDAQGRIYFVDRNKNIIRRSGENISAVEVERVLCEHPSVAAAAVAAVPDVIRGDEVFACIQLSGTSDPEAAANALVRWCIDRLAYFKAPGYVAFVDSLPVTSTQKIHRVGLKDLVSELFAGGCYIDTRPLKKRDVAAAL
jgi:acyl-CoA synthetase (AMP-forming)/AMP-acid ligase II